MSGTKARGLTFFIVLMLAGSSLAWAAPGKPPVNLLSNPSFETGVADKPEQAQGWGVYQGGYTRSRERSYAPEISGPWSCRLHSAGTENELGFGGTNTAAVDLPAHGTFAATNSIFVDSYTQGGIYGVYVTVRYADNSEMTFSFMLTDEQIKANLGRWKTYRLTFTTDPQKKLQSIVHWCLIWKKGEQKFIGTVYFDETELRLLEPGGEGTAVLPFAFASHTSTPPRIDGVRDDACWQQAVELPPFMLSRGNQAATEQTRAWASYDAANLYLFLECRESILDPVLQQRAAFKATQTQPDSAVWDDDAVEIFLQPSPEKGVYYHLIANSLGTLYDARCPQPGVYEVGWNSGAQIKTTVGDKSWTVEMAIPRQGLAEGSFAEGDFWRVNLCRTQKPAGEYSCWSPTGGAFHTPARFGQLAFGAPAVGGGAVELGSLRKGANTLHYTAHNAGPQPQVVTVQTVVGAGSGPAELGRRTVRLAPGQSEKLQVEYTALSGEGTLRYEVYHGDRLVLLSAGYLLQSDNPFIAYVKVLGLNHSQVINHFAVAQGELVTLPLVLLAGVEEEQFREAEVTLEVPAYLRLVNPLSATRRAPAPLAIEEQLISREGQSLRRLTLRLGAKSMTFPEGQEQREYVPNPLVFQAEYVGNEARPEPQAIHYQVRVNGREKAEGSVSLQLLPPLGRKSPRELVVCNWPCGSVYYGGYFNRLSPEEQLVTGESWLRTGFNVMTHAGRLEKLYRERGVKTQTGLPGTLDQLCASIPDVANYLRDKPQYQDATRSGKKLTTVIAPAHLLEPGNPVQQMLRDFAGKAARQYPVVSWDYEVPVSREESSGFGEANLAAFRKFAKLPDNVQLTPEAVVKDHLPQWIDFRCRQNAEVARLLYEGVKAANPNSMFFVYSGYQSPHTQVTYGVNWEYMAPHLDQVWCGYGRPVQDIQATLQVIQGKPLVGGELAWLGYGSYYEQDTSETHLMRRLTDSAGGFMVYYDWFMDGRFYSAVSRTAAVATDFEAFFQKGKRDDALARVLEGSAEQVTVYSLGQERLVFLFGSATGATKFKLQLPGLPAGAVAVDYWKKQKLAVTPELTVEVPRHGVQVIWVRPAAGTAVPAAPRLVTPVQDTVSDRRPLLVWDQAGAGACRYRVEVSANRAFPPAATIVADDVAGNTQVVTAPLDENGTYYWRVRATDVLNGRPSPWSPLGQFTLGVLGVTVKPEVFSPNGDGAYDTVELQAELRSEADWTVTVTNAAGQPVRTFTGRGGKPAVSWNGQDGAGKVVPEGHYELRLQVKGRVITSQKVEQNLRFGVPNRELEKWCYWRAQALDGGATEIDYQIPAGGRPYALKLTGTDRETKAYWSNYQSGTEIPITAGKTYTYSGLVKTDLAPGAKALVSLHFFTKNDRWAVIPGLEAEWKGVEAPLEGKQDWTKLTVSCQAPADAAKAVLFFSLRGQGTAWMSAVEFGEKK
jgi:hypothetical protein